MNNDPSSPDPSPKKKDQKTSKNPTEIGLWDIDSDETAPKAAPKTAPKTAPKKRITRPKQEVEKELSTTEPSTTKPSKKTSSKTTEKTPAPKKKKDTTKKKALKPKTSTADKLGEQKEDFKEPSYKSIEKVKSEESKPTTQPSKPDTKTEPEPEPKTEKNTPKSADQTNEEEEPQPEESKSETPPTKELAEKPTTNSKSFSKIEKISLASLAVILLLAASLTTWHFTTSVPTEQLTSASIKMPITGELVTINELSTYWRKPITTGENPDIIKRGTILIPAAKLQTSTKSAAIRILFRNEERIAIGDPITMELRGNDEIEIAATGGFKDKGMHTSHQTGDNKKWIIQIYEAPNKNSPSKELKLLLESEISTKIHY